MRVLLPVCLLVAVSLAPGAMGHGAPVVLDNEVVLLEDEGSDDMYVYDGFDLQYLYVREAYLQQQDLLVFRIAFTNGPQQPGWGPYLIEFDLSGGNETQTIGFTSQDGTGWTGDFEVVEEQVNTIDAGIVEIDFQALVPLSALGVERGDTLTGFTMRSFAKQDLIDEVPGGYYLPVTGRNVELTHWGVGEVAQDSYPLDGPTDYTNTTIADGLLQVQSLITVSGQHVLVSLGDAAGWVVSQNMSSKELDAGGTLEFDMGIQQTGADSLPVSVFSDLGGREDLFLVAGPNGLALTAEAPPPAAAGPAEETPSPAAGWLLVALLGLALRRSRRGP